jgi:hypothetical protein
MKEKIRIKNPSDSIRDDWTITGLPLAAYMKKGALGDLYEMFLSENGDKRPPKVFLLTTKRKGEKNGR